MEKKIDEVYSDAVASGLLPGVSVIAGDRDGTLVSSGISFLQKIHQDILKSVELPFQKLSLTCSKEIFSTQSHSENRR